MFQMFVGLCRSRRRHSTPLDPDPRYAQAGNALRTSRTTAASPRRGGHPDSPPLHPLVTRAIGLPREAIAVAGVASRGRGASGAQPGTHAQRRRPMHLTWRRPPFGRFQQQQAAAAAAASARAQAGVVGRRRGPPASPRRPRPPPPAPAAAARASDRSAPPPARTPAPPSPPPPPQQQQRLPCRPSQPETGSSPTSGAPGIYRGLAMLLI